MQEDGLRASSHVPLEQENHLMGIRQIFKVVNRLRVVLGKGKEVYAHWLVLC